MIASWQSFCKTWDVNERYSETDFTTAWHQDIIIDGMAAVNFASKMDKIKNMPWFCKFIQWNSPTNVKRFWRN